METEADNGVVSRLYAHRCIIHLDLDCFYAQVEARRLGIPPEKPLAVQQWHSLIAVNYAAKAKGIRRGEPASDALLKCPELVLVHVEVFGQNGREIDPNSPDIERYKASLRPYREASEEIMEIFKRYAPHMEKASVDEAFLDITAEVQKRVEGLNGQPFGFSSPDCIFFGEQAGTNNAYNVDVNMQAAAQICKEVRDAVYKELGYTCSAGIAHNKMIAKLASPMNKPNKQTVIPLRAVQQLLQSISYTQIRGLGGKLGKKIGTIFKGESASDIAHYGLASLRQKLGAKDGTYVYRRCLGLDDEPVKPRAKVQSILAAKSFQPVNEYEELQSWVKVLTSELSDRLEKDYKNHRRKAKTLTVGYRKFGFHGRSKCCHMPPKPTSDALFESAFNALKALPKEDLFPCANVSLTANDLIEEASKKDAITSFFNTKPEGTRQTPDDKPGGNQERSSRVLSNRVSSNQQKRDTIRSFLSNSTLPEIQMEEQKTSQGSRSVSSSAHFPIPSVSYPIPAVNVQSIDGKRERLPPAVEVLIISDSSEDERANRQRSNLCLKCGEAVPKELAQEHADFHYALELQGNGYKTAVIAQGDKTSTSSALTTGKAPARKRKETSQTAPSIKRFFSGN